MLEVRKLSKRYGVLYALRDLSFTVRPGEALYLSEGLTARAHAAGELPAWSVAWTLETGA